MHISSVVLAISLGSLSVVAQSAGYEDPYSIFTDSSHNWDPHTTIVTPTSNSTAFIDATERWNTFNPPTYAIAITPANEEDVARAVTIARSIDFPFLGTGGRHAFSRNLGALDEGLAIDLSSLDSVEVDAEAGLLTIGGGTRLGGLVDRVYEAGYQLPIGSCSCPGAVGATIGGGIGRWQGVDGLIMDNLLSVRMVTAEGHLIDVSADQNPDLFWAVRGAGANFGIITSATYRLSQQINNGQVLSADFIFPAASNSSFFDILESLEDNIPAELATFSVINSNATTGEAQILSNWVFLGPEDQGRELIAPLFDLNPIVSAVSVISYNNITDQAFFGLGGLICNPVSIKGYGATFRNLSSSTYQGVFQKMNDFFIAHPDGRTSNVEIEIFSPEAVERVASDATAYPWRDTKGYTGFSFGFNTTETEQAGDALALEIRSDFAATSGYDGLAVYVSYAHGDETPEQMWGSNVPRLAQLKQEWDPDNVFGFFQHIIQ